MKLILLMMVAGLFENTGSAQRAALPEALQFETRVGQMAPMFAVTDTEGKPFKLNDLKGKVVLVNFWATWCAPCQFEIPRLEREVWQKYKSGPFAMVGIAREQNAKEITKYQAKHGFTYPIAADPHRAVYGLFAEQGIPRNYVVGPDGKILFQTAGYKAAEFDRMAKVIGEAVGQKRVVGRFETKGYYELAPNLGPRSSFR